MYGANYFRGIFTFTNFSMLNNYFPRRFHFFHFSHVPNAYFTRNNHIYMIFGLRGIFTFANFSMLNNYFRGVFTFFTFPMSIMPISMKITTFLRFLVFLHGVQKVRSSVHVLEILKISDRPIQTHCRPWMIFGLRGIFTFANFL